MTESRGMNPDPLTVDESPDPRSTARDSATSARTKVFRQMRPLPGDLDAMSEREFQAFVIRIGMDANIRHALNRHGWYVGAFFLTLGLAFLGGWVVRGLR